MNNDKISIPQKAEYEAAPVLQMGVTARPITPIGNLVFIRINNNNIYFP